MVTFGCEKNTADCAKDVRKMISSYKSRDFSISTSITIFYTIMFKAITKLFESRTKSEDGEEKLMVFVKNFTSALAINFMTSSDQAEEELNYKHFLYHIIKHTLKYEKNFALS